MALVTPPRAEPTPCTTPTPPPPAEPTLSTTPTPPSPAEPTLCTTPTPTSTASAKRTRKPSDEAVAPVTPTNPDLWLPRPVCFGVNAYSRGSISFFYTTPKGVLLKTELMEDAIVYPTHAVPWDWHAPGKPTFAHVPGYTPGTLDLNQFGPEIRYIILSAGWECRVHCSKETRADPRVRYLQSMAAVIFWVNHSEEAVLFYHSTC